MHDYAANDTDELEMKVGDVVLVITFDNPDEQVRTESYTWTETVSNWSDHCVSMCGRMTAGWWESSWRTGSRTRKTPQKEYSRKTSPRGCERDGADVIPAAFFLCLPSFRLCPSYTPPPPTLNCILTRTLAIGAELSRPSQKSCICKVCCTLLRADLAISMDFCRHLWISDPRSHGGVGSCCVVPKYKKGLTAHRCGPVTGYRSNHITIFYFSSCLSCNNKKKIFIEEQLCSSGLMA